MKKVNERFGPLEWKLPESHAIYWAVVGLEKSDNLKKDDFIMLRRVIFQSMQLAFHRGRLIFPVKGAAEFTYGPNLEVVAKANQSYEEMIEQEPEKREHLGTAHKNFLKTAVEYLYTQSRNTQANEWFKYLLDKYPGSVPPEQNMDQFVLERVTEIVGETSHDKVKMVLEGLFINTFWNLTIGEDDLAVSYDRFAQRVWQRFQNEVGADSKKRVGLPPLATLKKEVLDRLLDPEAGLGLEMGNQLRTKLGLPAAPADPASPAATNQPPSALSRPSTNSPAPSAKTKR
jgi:hypothetical protein